MNFLRAAINKNKLFTTGAWIVLPDNVVRGGGYYCRRCRCKSGEFKWKVSGVDAGILPTATDSAFHDIWFLFAIPT